MSSDSSSMRVAYSLAAGAAAATALSAGADVIYSGLQDLSIGQFSSLNLNVDGDAYGHQHADDHSDGHTGGARALSASFDERQLTRPSCQAG